MKRAIGGRRETDNGDGAATRSVGLGYFHLALDLEWLLRSRREDLVEDLEAVVCRNARFLDELFRLRESVVYSGLTSAQRAWRPCQPRESTVVTQAQRQNPPLVMHWNLEVGIQQLANLPAQHRHQ